MSKESLKEMLEMMDAKLNHLEDISADNRAIIVKLVKQNNQIVEFLKQIELDIVDNADFIDTPNNDKLSKLMTLVEQFKESNEEFKDDITPGQFGES